MIGANLAEVFGYIPKELKARVERIKKATGHSISEVVWMGLERVVPELEQTLGANRPKGGPPSSISPKPRRRGKNTLYTASHWSFPPLNGEGK